MYSLAAGRNNSFLARLKSLLTFQNYNHTVVEGRRLAELYADLGPGEIEFSKWRKFNARKLGINQSRIPPSPWIVLQVLQNAGFEAYLVGGCVRDLLLNRIPKDFDVITTAALTQVRKKFYHAMIVGRKFPICQVHIKGCIVEVSSFDTVAEHSKDKEFFPVSQLPKGYDKKDLIRWRNCMQRDFTVNSLFFDPFVNKIYDYANALSDLMLSKLRTLIPAQMSFEEDCARILRGLRLAARIDLSFSEEAESAIHKLSSSILSLSKSRILMELNYMLSYGAAEPSLSLLQRFHLLDILLPVQAAHLTEQAREKSDQSGFLLMKLFSNLDQLVSCDRPADTCLWVAMLAFHLALVSNPQQALVVLTFGSVLYHGKWKEGIKFARYHTEEAHSYIPEISNYYDSVSDDELADKVTKLAVQVQKSINILTESDTLLKEMEKFPEFLSPGLVFVPRKFSATVKQIFEVLVKDLTSLRTKRASLEINYDSLKKGKLREVRFVLGKIIVHTMGIGIVAPADEVIKEEKDDLQTLDCQKDLDEFAETCLEVDERKSHLLNKTGKKRPSLPAYCVEEQVNAKKQKFTHKNGSLSEQERTKNQKAAGNTHPMDIAEKKQDLIKDSFCLEVNKNRRKVISEGIGCVLQGYTSKMQEKTDSHQVRSDDIQSMLGTLKFQARHEVPTKEQKPIGETEYKQSAEKYLKLLEQVNDDVSRNQQKSEETSLLQQESDIEKQKPVMDYVKSNNIHQNKGFYKPGKTIQGRSRTLSSLFK